MDIELLTMIDGIRVGIIVFGFITVFIFRDNQDMKDWMFCSIMLGLLITALIWIGVKT